MTDLTDKQLRYAKWYLKHKNQIHRGFVLVLIFLDVILITIIVSQAIFYFGSKEEHLKNMQGLTENRIDFLSFRQHFAPQPIVTDSLVVIRPDSKKSQYDFITTVFNPNPDWRATIEYYFLSDELEIFKGSNFINPEERKYFFTLGTQVVSEVNDIQFLISKISWRRMRQPQKDLLSILNQLKIEDIGLEYLQAENESLILPQISFKAKNNSIYDFWETRFVIALENNLNLVGLNVLSTNSWRANEEKNLIFVWPLIPAFTHIEIKTEIDVFNPKVFISPL